MPFPKDATPDEIRELRRRNNASPASRAARKRYDRSAKGKAAQKRSRDRRAVRDAIKFNARQQVFRAVRDGYLVRGDCERKGPDCKGRIEAHHEDYTKPLEVRWLCIRHHNHEHGKGL